MFLIDLQDETNDASDVARYNIAPTQMISCVTESDVGRRTTQFRWGLVPSWAKDLAIGNRMINARGETVDSKPSFRSAFSKRRCLIPADGYYEWKKVSDGKQPYLIHQHDDEPLAMAGLWEENTKASADCTSIRSCTIITTEANKTTSDIHDRMPVFLDESNFDQWLDPNYRDADQLKSLLIPAAEDLLRYDLVSRRVNSVKHDDASCVEPVRSDTLFD